MKNKTMRYSLRKRMIVFCAIMMMALLTLTITACSSSPSSNQPANKIDTSADTPASNVTIITVADATSMNKHTDNGVSCEECHGKVRSDSDYQEPEVDICYSCHSLESIIEATARYEDYTKPMENPHDSHVGTPRCGLCHSNHGDSTAYCNECHMPDYNIIVP